MLLMTDFEFNTDINECTTISNTCPTVGSYCVNTNGSFACECKTGFTKGADGITCEGKKSDHLSLYSSKYISSLLPIH